jgi:hypothetical protein
VFLNSGVSAAMAGATQSMFALFEFDDTAYLTPQAEKHAFTNYSF